MTKFKDVAHLYLGCEVCITHPAAAFDKDILDTDLLLRLTTDLADVIGYYKPLLRPLWEVERVYSPEQFLYLLSKGYDLFSLISNGEAIDKTKI